MELFSYEEIFCKHYKFLRENVEVFVSFNIDHCQSILNDNVTISLYYNDKLDVENEKSRLDKFAVKLEFHAKLPLPFLIFNMAVLFSIENLLTLLLLSIDN